MGEKWRSFKSRDKDKCSLRENGVKGREMEETIIDNINRFN